MKSTFSKSVFDPCLHGEFRVELPQGNSMTLTLIEVTELPPATNRKDLPIRQDPFSLVFKGPRDERLPQRIYLLHNQQLGQLSIFLVPIGFGEYQAIFN